MAAAVVLFAVQRAAAQPRSASPLHPAAGVTSGDASAGEQLFLTGCVSCHGVGGVGTTLGPSLIGVGAASADFYLTTGRMPATSPTGYPTVRKDPAYNPEQIADLVAYVASLGPGPPIPDVDTAQGDLARGGVLFRANCASCHQSAGNGGALSYGDNAPNLHQATATQVVEAMRVGPGQMPVFDAKTISDADAQSIARYIEYLRKPDNHGGLPLGGFGPVTEGFVALLFGLGGLVVVSVWIVGRRRRHLPVETGHA